MGIDCRECSLPVAPYKQLVQIESDVCEWCAIAVQGLEEFTDDGKYDEGAEYRRSGNLGDRL